MMERHEPEKGMLVRFLADNAFPFEIQLAEEKLVKNETYTISDIYKDEWGCYIYLEGVLNKSFKCTMFEDAGTYRPEEEPPMVRTVMSPKKKK